MQELIGLCGRFGTRLSLCSAWLVASLLVEPVASQAQSFTTFGLLGEYFTPLSSNDCVEGNGSINVFDGRLPTHTRRDEALDFSFTNQFRSAMPRCKWDRNTQGKLTHICRATDDHLRTFAVRWSGYLRIVTAGYYNFTLLAKDGARLIIGHTDSCPGVTCADRFITENSKLKDLRPTFDNGNDGINTGTYMEQCPLCASANYDYCWISSIGCEPFSIWHLEADGGLTANCGSGGRTFRGSRWLRPGFHPIRIEFFKRNPATEAELQIRYSGPDTQDIFRAFPRNRLLFPMGRGLRAEWYAFTETLENLPNLSGGSVVVAGKLLKREDDLLWDNAPEQGMPFSEEVNSYGTSIAIRWMGFFLVETGGQYTFRLTSDDGSRFVLGGTGGEHERAIVSNDGVHAPATTSENTVDLLPGLHPCRLEYFFQYRFEWLGGIPTPEGLSLSYQGPDTQHGRVQLMDPVSEEFSSRFQITDPDCPFSDIDFGYGMSQSRTCDGTCFQEQESRVGDGICDCPLADTEDGSIQCADSTFPRFYLLCSPYDNDAGDCVTPTQETTTTTRPMVTCLVTCPPGNYLRHDCSLCPEGSQDGLCIQSVPDPVDCDSPEECTYIECCAAFLQRTPYWGRTCISFGSTRNCSTDWPGKLQSLQQASPDMYAEIAGWSATSITGTLETYTDPATLIEKDGCNSDYCNPVPDDMIPHPITLLPTDEPVCLVSESSEFALECYEGPWTEIAIEDPLVECQDGRTEYNFCVNTKTSGGIPFQRCCAISFILDSGEEGCVFRGIPAGSCEEYRQVWARSKRQLYQSYVEGECYNFGCNNPMQEAYECTAVVIEYPEETMGGTPRPDQILPIDQLVMNAPEREEDGADLAPVFGVLAGVSAILLAASYGLYRACQKKEEPLWHSTAAIVMGKGTFIEPVKDAETNFGYNAVKPKPDGLRALERESEPAPVIVDARAIKQVPLAITNTADDVDGSPDCLAIQVVVEGETALALRTAATAEPMLDLATITDSEPDFLPGEVPPVSLPALPPPVIEEVPEAEPTPGEEIQAALQAQRLARPVAKVRSRPAAAARMEREGDQNNIARWVVR